MTEVRDLKLRDMCGKPARQEDGVDIAQMIYADICHTAFETSRGERGDIITFIVNGDERAFWALDGEAFIGKVVDYEFIKTEFCRDKGPLKEPLYFDLKTGSRVKKVADR